MDLFLFDDRIARSWEPFSLTRPAGELLFGTYTLRSRIERAFGARCRGQITSQHLIGFEEDNAPPAVEADGSVSDRPRLFILSRFVPDGPVMTRFTEGSAGPILAGNDEVIGWYVPAGDAPPDPEWLLTPATDTRRPTAKLTGRLLQHVWELMSANPDRLAEDIRARAAASGSGTAPDGVHQWGDEPLLIDPTAAVEPGAALVTTDGPIWLDRGARVRAFTRLVGPAYVGPDSAVLGGAVEAVSIGPVCRVRGELAESVCLGYVNKQHDGHIGHAYLGRWVNLGAETTNSDLKNNYGTIRLWTPDGEVDTGEIKVGSFIGDHVKTGIGLLLNTGTVIGAGSNLYGSAMPPTYVPPFSWGSGDQLTVYRLDKFLDVAEQAMGRRDVRLTDAMKAVLEAAWKQVHGEDSA